MGPSPPPETLHVIDEERSTRKRSIGGLRLAGK